MVRQGGNFILPSGMESKALVANKDDTRIDIALWWSTLVVVVPPEDFFAASATVACSAGSAGSACSAGSAAAAALQFSCASAEREQRYAGRAEAAEEVADA